MSRVPDIDEFLDPKSLTPQELYSLQSETWADGVNSERERIIKLLIEEGVLTARSNEDENDQQIIELIKGEQK